MQAVRALQPILAVWMGVYLVLAGPLLQRAWHQGAHVSPEQVALHDQLERAGGARDHHADGSAATNLGMAASQVEAAPSCSCVAGLASGHLSLPAEVRADLRTGALDWPPGHETTPASALLPPPEPPPNRL